MSHFVFLTAFLCLFVTFGDTLRCYECSAFENSFGKNCFHPEKNKTHQCDCRDSTNIIGHHPDMSYQCVAILKHDNKNHSSVERRCVVKKDFDFCEDYTSRGKYEGYSVDSCFSCGDDLCNSGVKIGVVVLLPVLALIWTVI